MGPAGHGGSVLESLLDGLRGRSAAVHMDGGSVTFSRSSLGDRARDVATAVAPAGNWTGDDQPLVWVTAASRVAMLVGAIGALEVADVAVVEPESTVTQYDQLAAAAPPAAVVCDAGAAAVAAWARLRGVPTICLPAVRGPGNGYNGRVEGGHTLIVFTSGTVSGPKAIRLRPPNLDAAVPRSGVATAPRHGRRLVVNRADVPHPRPANERPHRARVWRRYRFRGCRAAS